MVYDGWCDEAAGAVSRAAGPHVAVPECVAAAVDAQAAATLAAAAEADAFAARVAAQELAAAAAAAASAADGSDVAAADSWYAYARGFVPSWG